MIFALIGNQNCGKTTLFNRLTGANRHVGNFPGVTVDEKSGAVRGHADASVVDLPGIYSLRPYTNEEIVTRDFLLKGHPDGIINIVDATNMERNLYLTLQLLEIGLPTVLALNMMDEVRENGGTVEIEKLSEELGIPVVPISAAKNEGVDELIERAVAAVKSGTKPKRIDFCPSGPVHRCIHAVAHLIEDHAARAGMPARFAATKVIEEDRDIVARLSLDENEKEMIEHSVIEMEREEGLDRHEALATMRYDFIERVCAATVVRCRESRERRRSLKIDSVLTHKVFAIPVFLLIMLTVFTLTFAVFGDFFSNLLELGIGALGEAVDAKLADAYVNPVIRSLIVDGIFGGVGSVVSFVPYIVVLFFFLSILEDTGYMARIAFVMDKPLRKIGLSGRSFVPMLIGFGCTVPAVMATRTLSSERDRRMTVLLTPFMSCSAKMTIYLFFVNFLFENPLLKVAVMAGLYLLGVLVGILSALVLKRTLFRGDPVPFVMELPNYRFPSAKSVFLLMWEKAKDFLQKAFTVILLASVIIWFLSNFDLGLYPVGESAENSILAKIGGALAVIFRPLGFGRWETVTALIAGFSAKEAVVSTLGMLTTGSVAALFTTESAVSFLVFTLIYTPCIAAIAAVKNELGTRRAALGVVVGQCAIAWVVSFLVYRIASLFSVFSVADLLLLLAVLAWVIIAAVILHRSGRGCCHSGCSSCASCGKEDGCACHGDRTGGKDKKDKRP